jgi:hypothetical protein
LLVLVLRAAGGAVRCRALLLLLLLRYFAGQRALEDLARVGAQEARDDGDDYRPEAAAAESESAASQSASVLYI